MVVGWYSSGHGEATLHSSLGFDGPELEYVYTLGMVLVTDREQ